ncbi:MAG: hypothetical protein Q9165_002669 [Trypethelium subeluteriae]
MWWPFGLKYPERQPEEVDGKEYDYVIIGGGTAGCALASRLSEDPNVSVLLLERGVANDTWISRVPLISSNILNPETGAVSWYCESMKEVGDRKSLIVRGDVLGGSSRVNAMVYTRGSIADYDSWSSMGHPDWSYEKVLPYFKKAEKVLDQSKSDARGKSGPWINQTIEPANWPFRVVRVVKECAEALGFHHITDTNSTDALCDGFATLDLTIDQNMQRMSTLEAYLPRKTALKREKHLGICTASIVSRIEFSGKTNPRAERVHFQSTISKSQKTFSVNVEKEVVVCSGATGSPQVLMLSGIGPREHLKEHGIDVVRDLPGIGSDLWDHVSVPVAWEVPIIESLTYLVTSPLKGALEFLKYFFTRTGIFSIPFQVASLFVRSSSLDDQTSEFTPGIPSKPPEPDDSASVLRDYDHLPDIEIMPLATSAMDDLEEHEAQFSKIGVFSLLTTLLRPKSRGTVRLRSADPLDRPKVDLGFMADAEDIALARKAIRLSLRLGDDMKAQGFPLLRGITAPDSAANNAELDELIKRRARTTYHYSSTCRMAPEHDTQAPGVVDDALRVHGISNLRVCDASIFPQIISTHLQAPVVMVAEKCADMMKASHATK